MQIEEELDILSNFTHISYDEKIRRAKKELLETDPNKIIKRGWEERDNALGGIYGGKIYLVGGKTGTGKSTLINQICNSVSRQGWKVVKYSLEDRMEDIGKEEIFYAVNRLRRKDDLPKYPRCEFVNNEIKGTLFSEYVEKACTILSKRDITELDKTKQVNIDELCYLMEQECDKGAKMFAIDHLHYFEFDGAKERLDLQIQNVMIKINEIARRRNVAVFIVAHYKNNVGKDLPDPSRFKDAAAIKQVANVIIQIERDIGDIDNTSTFYFTKLRGPIKLTELETTFNMDTFEYNFTEKSPEKKDLKNKGYI